MSAQRLVRRAMFAISSRNALCLAERACPHGARRRVFAFLVKGGTALGTVALLVLASIIVVAHRST